MNQLFMTFLVYSVIGWIWETFYCSFKDHKFVYRGFLLGPYCPVYGFGVVTVLVLVPHHAGTMLNLYFNIVVIVTIIEFVTSWLLEKLFNMKLWDYTHVPLNIEGRVAVPVSFFWGIGCLLLIKVINPVIQSAIQQFLYQTSQYGGIVLAVLFFGDVATTFLFTLTTKKEVEAAIDESDKENAAIKEFRWKQLITNHESSHNRNRVLQLLSSQRKKWRHRNLSRIVKNYPNIRFKKRRLVKTMNQEWEGGKK
jgi:uncharacterized membrane protein